MRRVYQQVVGRRCRKCLGDLVQDVAGVRKERQSSRSRSLRSCNIVSVTQISIVNAVPVCWHFLKSHLKEDLPKLMSNFVYCSKS